MRPARRDTTSQIPCACDGRKNAGSDGLPAVELDGCRFDKLPFDFAQGLSLSNGKALNLPKGSGSDAGGSLRTVEHQDRRAPPAHPKAAWRSRFPPQSKGSPDAHAAFLPFQLDSLLIAPA